MHTDSSPRRWVEFAEIDNVRDLGGLPVSGGGVTRFGTVYRASTPQHLTEDDLLLLTGQVGLRTLIDLRNPDEVEREGYGLLGDAAVRLVNLPVRKAAATTATPADLVPDAKHYDLVALYRELLDGSVESVLTAVRLITDTERHSVVFHCAAGKDRTGVLAAVLLDAVGVPAEFIAADYALSGERMARVRARLDALPSYHGLPPVRTGILAVEPTVMSEFLTRLHADHGGAAGWLRAHGLGDRELSDLRRVLVEN
ncbi:Tyrosine phosphatase family C-terminal region [Nocardia amikacinitolerans]|uniref:tyrosine-protein phosphatase n=1 Tax=Nocardia amikacinitolerans TaxID=756689 RepID=UPI00082C0A57|nr:tyrosine-protein phosphatase [Nocardia amikacinitolerans]MCP2315234.1 Tyrosine phosphatase family C-terminal region [Nocardia amikacinitolerans]